jgi:hypothetical protein
MELRMNDESAIPSGKAGSLIKISVLSFK